MKQSKKFKKIFEKIITENIPDLVKEIDIQVQEAQRVPNKMDAKRPTSRHNIIKIPKVKDKERILRAARKEVTYLKVSSHKIFSRFLNRNFVGQKGLARSIQLMKSKGPQPRLPIKAII